MPSFFLRRSLRLLVCLTALTPAWAEESPATRGTILISPEPGAPGFGAIAGGARTATPLKDLPAAVDAVRAETVAERGLQLRADWTPGGSTVLYAIGARRDCRNYPWQGDEFVAIAQKQKQTGLFGGSVVGFDLNRATSDHASAISHGAAMVDPFHPDYGGGSARVASLFDKTYAGWLRSDTQAAPGTPRQVEPQLTMRF
ncbi:hypothetical protein [Paenirhodobacter sp.]|uniref:hypothetical protein n=1 Tax=Paenirhodobacter sp. TaxID=1965326 RepID=UPI003B405B06